MENSRYELKDGDALLAATGRPGSLLGARALLLDKPGLLIQWHEFAKDNRSSRRFWMHPTGKRRRRGFVPAGVSGNTSRVCQLILSDRFGEQQSDPNCSCSQPAWRGGLFAARSRPWERANNIKHMLTQRNTIPFARPTQSPHQTTARLAKKESGKQRGARLGELHVGAALVAERANRWQSHLKDLAGTGRTGQSA
jgi:hypothetical protein